MDGAFSWFHLQVYVQAVFIAFFVLFYQIESRPLRKQLVGASDDNNNGYPK